MTRKQLPKAIRNLNLRGLAAAAAKPDDEAQAPQPAASNGAFETEAAGVTFARPAANDQFPAAANPRLQSARLRLARRIVERHKTYAALGGLSPLPVLNVAGVTAVILRMVKQLSALYDVPFERERTRSALIALMGGAVPTGFGTAAASTLAFIVPGSTLVGLGITAITAGALTRGIGLVFVEHFESTGMPLGAAQAQHA
jgi:uncharacterized protein (DUF697 family)